jgi:hypothetical protein
MYVLINRLARGLMEVSLFNSLYSNFHGTGETVSIVGDTDPSLMKFFDCTRSAVRSPFDDDVVYQFEYMEYVCSQTPSTSF